MHWCKNMHEMHYLKRSHMTLLRNLGLLLLLMSLLTGTYLYMDSIECQKFKMTFEFRYPHQLKYLENGYSVVEINDM